MNEFPPEGKGRISEIDQFSNIQQVVIIVLWE
jgi:hypothetical protein